MLCYVRTSTKKFAFDVIMFLQQFSYCIWYCDVYHLTLRKLQQKNCYWGITLQFIIIVFVNPGVISNVKLDVKVCV